MKELFKDLWFAWTLLVIIILVMVIFHIKFSWVGFLAGCIGGLLVYFWEK